MSTLVLDREYFLNVFRDMLPFVDEQSEHLQQLDSEIGDGDHGINLTIGFREVTKQLDTINEEAADISTVFKKIGMILLGKVGGSSGPLYGSFFMKAGKDVTGKDEVTFDEFCGMLINGIEAIQLRGKAEVGDKTMIDAFLPGVEVLKQDKPEDPIEKFTAFVEAMKEGAESTIPLVAKKGRAMRLGERAVGHKDPGAESAWMMMEVFLKRLKEAASA
ncbi:dihydroxyacetone kinase subunit DhaL [Oceanobacillus jeddahense]|uniref:dihydroxyacetone kinase subunit DhaL n=1 Tax=Oceanobacillus jeddahense TaxID=1462527 RepID=UPI0005959ED6|nr:dihydroxyacetone kinase subunit DhaL [Oceanobacillus jeddahense]